MLLFALSAIVFMALVRGLSFGLDRLPRGFMVCAAAWIALSIASVAWSDDRAYTASELQREILYGAFAFVVLFVGTRTLREARIATFAVLCGTLLLGTLEWARHLMPWLPYAGKYEAAQGPFSTHIALAAPLLALLAWPSPSGFGAGWKTIAVFAVAIIAAGLATENRMLWLALAAGCIVAFAVFQAGAPPDAQRARMLRILLGTLALIALATAASWEYKAAHHYPRASTAAESISMDERPRVWSIASGIVAERPLNGHGFGREIAGDRIEHSLPPTTSVHIRHAHNVFLDAAVQLGAAGVLVLLALLASLAHFYARLRQVPGGGGIAIAGLALITTFIVKNLTDDFFFRPNSLTFWALNGMLLGLATRTRT